MQALGLCIGRTPTGAIPDINGMQWRGMLDLSVNVLGEPLEQGRLLATGNKHVVTGAQMLGGNAHFAAAQLIYCDHLLCASRFLKRLGIERL